MVVLLALAAALAVAALASASVAAMAGTPEPAQASDDDPLRGREPGRQDPLDAVARGAMDDADTPATARSAR